MGELPIWVSCGVYYKVKGLGKMVNQKSGGGENASGQKAKVTN